LKQSEEDQVLNKKMIDSFHRLTTEDQAAYLKLNATNVEFPVNRMIHELFYERVQAHPDRIALAHQATHLTYQDLNERSNQVAHLLREQGVKANEIVAILMERGVDIIVSILGVLKAGAAYTSIDPNYPEDRVRYMLEDSESRFLLSQKSLVDRLSELNSKIICVEEIPAETPASNLETINQADDIACVIYTSGSTGRPKGTLLLHRGIVNFVQWMHNTLGYTEEDTVMSATTFSFDASAMDMFGSLLNGAKMYILSETERYSPEAIAHAIELTGGTRMFLTTSLYVQFATFLTDEEYTKIAKTMKTILTGGEALLPEVVRSFQRRFGSGIQVVNGYGPTETTIYATTYLIDKMIPEDLTNMPIGTPLSNYQVYVLNEQMEICPVGVEGELYIGGVGVGKGYWNQADKTEEVFVPNPFSNDPGALLYKTGDLVRLSPNGYMEYVSRIDDQVKVRGFRIELGEITEVLLQHPEVLLAAVISRRATDGNNSLYAYYTSNTTELDQQELKVFLGQKVPEFMIPSRIVKLDAMPLNPNGKVDRKVLVELAENDLDQGSEYTAPATPTEEMLAVIWSEVMRRERVGRNDNFFDLGGHSLLAMQLCNRVQKQLGVRLELKDLYENPTIQELAAWTDEKLASGWVAAVEISRVAEQEYYQLSNAQKRLWFFYKMDPDNRSYNLPFNFILRSAIQPQAFEQALQYLVERHPALRTVFLDVDGIPRQKIQEKSNVRLYHEDLTGMDTADQQSYIAKKVRESEAIPFDLTVGPLLRVMLFTLSETDSYFYVCTPHIINDGWSHDLFMAELSESYGAFLKGEQPSLAELPLRYVDYAEWQDQEVVEGKLAQEEEYWLAELAKPLPVLELPTDFPRPEVQTFNGDLLVSRLPQDLHAKLQAVAKQEDVSMQMLLFAAYATLMNHLSQNDDIIIGIPSAGRPVEAIESVMGYFAQTLAIRTNFEGVQTLGELLQVVKQKSLNALANQSYPFDLLIEKINPERDASRTPVFSTMFWHQYADRYEQDLGNFEYQMLVEEVEHTTAMNDLILVLIEGEDDIRLTFEYNTDLFGRETIARFVKIFVKILYSFANKLAEPIQHLDLLIEDDLAVYSNMNDTAKEYDLNRLLHQAFIEQAEAHPERIALSYEGKTMTYGELDQISNQLAHFLREQGVQRNQYVAILMERSLEMMVALYAILKSGAAYVPIDPDYPAQRVQYMIDDSKATVLLTKAVYGDQVAGIANEVGNLRTVLYTDTVSEENMTVISAVETYTWNALASLPTTALTFVNEPTDLAYMIYTSGSTGQPKGVKLPHRAVVNSLTWMQESYHLVPEDVVAQRTSFCFDTSVWELFWPLREGASIAILSTETVKDPNRLFNKLVEEKVSVVNFVPSLFSVFGYSLEGMEAARREQLQLRWVLLCGEPVVQKPVNLWYDMFPSGSKIVNLYGPTEAAIAVTGHILEGKQETTISIGTPKPNVQMYVLDRNGKMVPVGVPGELHLGGVQLADGYHDKPDKTEEVFIPNHLPGTPGDMLYKTGDLVRVMANGHIEYISRIDNQVKVRGYRIELGEIEEALSQHPDVELAIVVTPKGPDGNYTLFGFYTTMSEGLEIGELREFLAERLPEYMVPGRLQKLDSMPLAPNGKADRKALSMMAAQDSFALTHEYIAPSTPIEIKLAAIWSEFLKRDQISVNDNFFELGGHSLLAMQIFNRVQKELQTTVELKDLFKHPTLGKLAAHLDELLKSGKGKEVLQIPRSGQRGNYGEHYALSNSQKRLWFLHKMHPESRAYHVPMHVKLSGSLDVKSFEKALDFLVMRHMALRTVFIELNGVPRQVVMPNGNFRLVYHDLSSMNTEEQRTFIQEAIEANESVPFELRQGPLLRAMLFTLNPEESYFYLNMHHIITDNWSNNVFVKDLAEFYSSLVSGQSLRLESITHQYVDYAEWQEKELKNGRWKQEEEYWLQKLAKPLPVLELPTDFERPEVQTYDGDMLIASLPAELAERLRMLTKQEGVSMYMVLLSAYVMLMHYLTHDEDIIIGTPIAGRTVESLEPIIGYFSNTLAIRTHLHGAKNLKDLLEIVKQQTLDAYENQNYPFDLLIEKIRPERNTGRSPIFSTMFVLEKATLNKIRMDNLLFEEMVDAQYYKSSKYDLTAWLIEGEEEIRAAFEYNTDLFTEQTIGRFIEIYFNILQAFTAQLTAPLGTLELLPESDRALYQQLNDSARDYDTDKTIPQAFYEAVAKFPDRIALSSEEGEMTYAELNERTNQVAHMLRERGIEKGDFIGIVMGRCLDTVISLMGIMKAGGVYVPIDPEYPEDRIRYQIADSGSPYIITRPEYLDKLQEILSGDEMAGTRFKEILLIEDSLAYDKSDVELITSADDLCYVIYTSGSTGRPKGALLKHRGIINLVEWGRERYGFNETDVVLEFASYSFDASVWDTYLALFLGARSHLLAHEERLSIEKFADAVQNSKATTVMLMAVFFKQLATYLTEEDYKKLATMKVIYVTGEVLSAEVLRLWQRRFGTEILISNAGGPTECTVYVGAYDAHDYLGEEFVNVPIGTPVSNYKMYILNDRMQELPVNVTGEIFIETVALAQGYLNQPEKTAEVFLPNPFVGRPGPVFNTLLYKTGDLGKLLPEGNVEILGRKDHQVKVRGYRIEMGEIETVMLQHEEVEVASVVVRKAVDGSNMLYGFYTTVTETSELSANDLKIFLSDKLPDFMIPTQIIRLDAMPLSPTGKVDRKALGRIAEEGDFITTQVHETPVTPTEEKLAVIWSEILHRGPISRNDNFFELGGHSLLATQVFNRIYRELQVTLELKSLFAYPVLQNLATHVDELIAAGKGHEEFKIVRAQKQGHYELSNAQKRLWFLNKFDPTNTSYNVAFRYIMEGKLEVQLLDEALQYLAMRHDSLRTVFIEVDENPRQKVKAISDITLDHEDLSAMTEEAQLAYLNEKIRLSEATPFDLEHGPLTRVMLFTLGEEKFYFYLSQHHIITDGWSMDIFLKELTAAYAMLATGAEPELPPLPLQYVDYAVWQDRKLKKGDWAEDEAFWLDTLAKPLPVLELPTDFPRPEVQTYNGKMLFAEIPKDLADQLRSVSKAENVSTNMIMLSAYVMLLNYLTQNEDIIVGTAVAGRSMESLEPIVGFFVNTVAIRTRFEGIQTIDDLMQRIKTTALDAYAHQSYPFDVLIEKVNPQRDTSRSPIFSALFNYLKLDYFDLQMGDVNLTQVPEMDRYTSRFDLSLEVEESESFHLAFEYNTDLFKEETITRFIQIYRNILQAFATEVRTPLVELDFRTEEDIAVYTDMNNTAVEYNLDQLLLDAFVEQAKTYPERIALSYEGKTMTYGELHERSNRLAHFLRAEGVQRNQLVAIMMERGLEMMVGLYGIVKSGAAYVPIDPEYPAQRVKYMITDSQAAVLLSKQTYAGQIADIADELDQLNTILYMNEDELADVQVVPGVTTTTWQALQHLPTTNPEKVNVPSDIAYMIYTSGSTGQPKGATVPHDAIVNRLLWHQEQFQAAPGDVIAQRTSVCFDVSVWELFWALRHGAKISILPSEVVKDPFRMHAHLNQEKVTVMHFVPSLFTAFATTIQTLPDEVRAVPSLRWVVTSGEALPVATVNLWFDLWEGAPSIANLYGPTEAAVDVSCWIIDGKLNNVLIGWPIANTQLYVINPFGQLCPVNVKGELHIGGVQLATGYHNKPEKTAEAFIPNHLEGTPGERLYRTGDVARILPDGNIEYLGRIDNQVKVRGFRIEMGEIEEAMTQHPDVDMAAVIVRKGPDGNNALFSFYTSKRADLDAAELRKYLGAKMPDYMVPSRMERVDVMPLSPNGKLDRKSLALLADEDAFDNDREYVAPETATEEQLATIWSEVLKRSPISRHDNFFELGGHSLLATQVFNRIHRELNVSLQLKSLFAHATLEKLAAHVDALKSEGQAEVVKIQRAAKQEHYAVSNGQKRLWFLYKFDPNSTTYNVPFHYRVNGKLDYTALDEAIQYLVMRHDSLRTVFVEVDDVPRQVVRAESQVGLRYEDVSKKDPAEQLAYIQQQIKVSERVPFRLTEGPLMRVMVFAMSEEQTYLYLNLHHIITDGWSMERFMKELSEVYAQFERGETPELAPLELQYVDYAQWQEQQLASGKLYEQEEAFWLETLAKPLPVLDLPVDYPRPEVQTQHGDMLLASLTPEMTEQLRTLAKQADVSMYMLSLTAYVMLLNYLTQNDDIIVGTPNAGRTIGDLEPIVGFFVNTLPIRVQLNDVHNLQDLLQLVKNRVLDADAHQSYPFDVLIDKVKPDRDTSRTPIFSTMFAYETAEWMERAMGQLVLETVLETEHTISKFDLTLVMVEEAEQYTVGLEYNTDLFKRETVARFMDMYRLVLQSFVSDVTAPIDSLNWLLAEDQAVYAKLNDTAAEFPADRTIHDLFYEQAAKHPDRLAISHLSENLTYRQLNERSNQVAHVLRERGLQTNEIVAVMMERSVDLVVAILGVIKAGGAYVPVDPHYPQDRIHYMLEDSGSRLLLTQRAVVDQAGDSGHEIICIEEIAADVRTDNLEITNTPQDLAYVIYTSGSTGRPKGTLLTHVGVTNLATWMHDQFGYTESSRVLQFASYSFDASVWETFTTLLNGASLHLLSDTARQSVEAFADAVQQTGATAVLLPTVFFKQIATYLSDEELSKLATMQTIFVGGEALPAEMVRAWQRRFGTQIQIVNAYGPTEATVIATVHPIAGLLADGQLNIPIGGSIPNTEVYILNRFMQPCAVNVVGELCIGGVGLATGYLNQPDKTDEVFVPHPFQPGAMLYKSGDMAKLLPDGTIEYVGRRDTQVKIRGFRIEIGEIEEVLLQHPAVETAAVIPQKGVDGNYQLIAFYTPAGESVEADELKQFMAQKLSDYMVPAVIHELASLPLSPSGKVDRKSLTTLAEEGAFTVTHEYQAPVTETEEKLSEVWSVVLKKDQVGRNDNFFELGGHSLLATQVFNRIQKELGVKIELKNLFTYATLEKLAAHVDELVLAGHTVQAQIPVAQKQERYPLSNAQKRLWFLYKFDPTNNAYDVPMHYSLQGKLDALLFEQALNVLIMRHDTLRTVFVEVDEKPYQVIQATSDFRLVHEDVTSMEEAEQRAYMLGQIDAIESVPFNLAEGPLMRAVLFSTGDEQSYFYLNMHHIITDGWSMERLINELADVYTQLEQGQTPQLAPLTLQYVDYAVWQVQEIEKGALNAKEEAYWLKTLAKPLPVLELATDFPRPDVQTYHGNLLQGTLPSALTADLQTLAKQEGVSMYMLTFAAYTMLMHVLTQNEDIIVGSPVSGRTVESLEPIMGVFINTLAIRTRFEGVHSLRDLLQVVKGQILDADAHQAYPFDLLIDKIKPDRDTSRSPIFSTMYNYLAFETSEKQLGQVVLKPIEDVEYKVSKYDLSVSMSERAGEFEYGFEYNTDLFKQETIQRFAQMYQLVLQAFATQFEAPLAELNLLTEADRDTYVQLNDTATEYDLEQLLHDAFVQQAEAHPERTALSYEGTTMTYGELHERSNRLAHFLRAQGVQPNTLVAVKMERSLEMIVCLHGILKSGAAYVPIDPDYPAHRVQYMLTDSEATVLLSKQMYAEQIAEIVTEAEQLKTILYMEEVVLETAPVIDGIVTYTWNDLRDLPVENLPSVNTASDLAYMIYTSGSTGQPKGTKLPHRAVVNSLNWMQDNYQLNERDVVAQRTSFCFDTSIWELFWPLRAGAAMAILSTEVVKDPTRLYQKLVDENVTVVNFVPSLFAAFAFAVEGMTEEQRNLLTLRWVLLCGEPVQLRPVNTWYDMYPSGSTIINLYGPTEAAIAVTGFIIEGKQEHSIAIGKPMANIQLYVLNKQGGLCPVGVAGELVIGGVQLADGYHNKQDKTDEVFIPNHLEGTPGDRLYRTGDLARILPNGNIECLGRIDNQVKVRGYRIELGEIEEVLAQHPEIELAVTIVDRGTDGSGRLVAYYTTVQGMALDAAELREFAGAKLPDYMVPPWFVHLAVMPLAPNGKIDRKALPKLELATIGEEYVAPRTELEQRIVDTWMQSMRLEQIGVHDNFFDIGGDSIVSMQVVSRMSQAGLLVKISDLFKYQTVAELAEHIEANGLYKDSVIVADQVIVGEQPLSHVQRFAFALDMDHEHFLAPVVLDVARDVSADLMQQTIQTLVNHHDMLRATFVRDEVGIKQVLRSPEEVTVDLEVFDLTEFEGNVQEEYARIARELAASMSFGQGLLMKAALLRFGDRSSRVFWLINHLVTDAVSLGILQKDLVDVYEKLEQGLPATLSSKGTSYAEWTKRCIDFINSNHGEAVYDYWNVELASFQGKGKIPVDYPSGTNRVCDASTAVLTIDRETTSQLRGSVGKVYGMAFNEILMTAIMRAVAKWSNESQVGLTVNGHGRNMLLEEEGMDLSRTVGFFTNTYPVYADVSEGQSIHETAEQVQDRLERMPNGGASFGMLNFLSTDPTVLENGKAFQYPDVFFNFFGTQFENNSESEWNVVQEFSLELPQEHEQFYKLSIVGFIQESSLNFNIAYSQELYRWETIEDLVKLIEAEIQAFVAESIKK